MAIDWTELCTKYRGLWVALREDKKTVVASGTTVKEVMENAKQRGYEAPTLFHVPAQIVPFVGAF